MTRADLGAASSYPPIDYQDIYYYAAPKAEDDAPKSLDEVDPEAAARPTRSSASRCTSGRRWPASRVDAVFDSVSVATTFKEKLAETRRHLLLVLRGGARAPRAGAASTSARSCRYADNFFAALNSAVFTDGSFVYIPKGVRCPMELSTYFRINAANTGQFERTLIIADEGAYVSYLEGCTAPHARREPAARRGGRAGRARRRRDQVLDGAELVPGRRERQGRHLQLRHQARRCAAARDSKISWTQVETGSAITWKYPSCILQGRRLGRRVLLGRAHQQLPAGRHRHQDDPPRQEHPQSRSSPRASRAGHGQNTYRGLVRDRPEGRAARATTPSATRC